MVDLIKKEQSSDYIYITEDRGIKKKIIKEGKDEYVIDGSQVNINYIGKDNTATIFGKAKEQKEQNYTFTIGGNKAIKVLEIVLKTMKVGEKAEFILSPDYNHINQNICDLIPGELLSTFQIELLKVVNPKKKLSDMNYTEKLAEAKELKGKGVEKYKLGDISSARDLFTRAIEYLEDMDKNNAKETEGIELYVTILSNLCNCFDKQKEYNSVINFASKGLKIKELPKLYYFRAIAYANNEEIDLSKKDLESLKNISGKKSNIDEGIKLIIKKKVK